MALHRATVHSMELEVLEVRHLRDSILAPSALLFLEYAVLDDMAATPYCD